MSNAEQIRNWDGPAGEHWVREAARYDGMVAAFGHRLLAAVDPRPGERALEVGCGTGALAVDLARRVAPAGCVTGVDVSGPMLAAAADRAAAAGVDVTWVKADAQVHPFPAASFDVVVSRFGVMFFDDPVAAFANLAAAMVPGGRIGVVVWQDLVENDWITVPAGAALAHVPAPPPPADPTAPGPFALADPVRLADLLDRAGLAGVDVREVRAPMLMAPTVDDVMAFYARTEIAEQLIARAEPAAQAAAWAAVRAAVEARSRDGGVWLSGAAWLVTARRPD